MVQRANISIKYGYVGFFVLVFIITIITRKAAFI